MDIRRNITRTFFYQVVKNYDAYLGTLLMNTFYVGIVSLVINWVYVNSDLHDLKMDWQLQGLIGFVIGLLLVFRTNTAYDRWWEGRKMLADLSRVTQEIHEQARISEVLGFSEILVNFVNQYISFLTTGEQEDLRVAQTYFYRIYDISISNFREDVKPMTYRALNDLNVCIHAGERIKRTPIPIAYTLHIKMTLNIYIFSLPFSSFYSMGLYSTILVMILYFLISGIEIISTEIEDPFAGDPNDLPLEEFRLNILSSLEESKGN